MNKLHVLNKRECGSCTACCVVFDIPEVDKAPMVHCKFLDQGQARYEGNSAGGNCKIYDSSDKPKCCSTYNCAWKAGFGDEEDRPDKALILFDRSHLIENALEAKSLVTGQEDTSEGRAVIERMSRSYGAPTLVLDYKSGDIRRVVGRGM